MGSELLTVNEKLETFKATEVGTKPELKPFVNLLHGLAKVD